MVSGISISPHCSACHSFIGEVDGIIKTRTVWLSPIEINIDKDRVNITWQCSLSSFCLSPCRYSEGKDGFSMH